MRFLHIIRRFSVYSEAHVQQMATIITGYPLLQAFMIKKPMNDNLIVHDKPVAIFR